MTEQQTEQNTSKGMTYAAAGVNIEAGNQLVERIKPLAKSTMRPEVLGNLGGFGALCAIPKGYDEPILVSGADGVGTKLKLAIELNQHDTIGIDLVAMCVNDLLVCGAEPLFFLDYYGSGELNVDQATDIISGIAQGCRESNCALVGGETAELPGLYHDGDYDLAGFCVGVVEKSKIITGESIVQGDILIGLASSGVHSNGYSLVRKILTQNNISLQDRFISHQNQQVPLGQALLTPTRIYAATIQALKDQYTLKGLAHITGGGLTENLPRVMPNGLEAHIALAQWPTPAIFDFIATEGQISTPEMLKTFNMGIGMIMVVPATQADAILQTLANNGEQAWKIGEMQSSKDINAAPSVVYA